MHEWQGHVKLESKGAGEEVTTNITGLVGIDEGGEDGGQVVVEEEGEYFVVTIFWGWQ